MSTDLRLLAFLFLMEAIRLAWAGPHKGDARRSDNEGKGNG